jgi:DNA-binding NarL/FixJ family response regulator
MTTQADVAAPGRVRVVIVDDSAEIREILRRLFARDDRFHVVAEGTDGVEAIELVTRFQPDVLVIDQQMPRLGGVEAMPAIRAAAPSTAVIIFTARADAGLYQAALSAGATDVMDKSVGPRLADQLAETLVDHWAGPDAEIQVQVGPVASEAASAWIANTRRILAAVVLHPEVLPRPVPPDVVEVFAQLLDTWDEVNHGSQEFFWTARAAPADVNRLVEWWAVIDSMSDDQLERLGVRWSVGEEGEPFFHALTAGVLAALSAHATTQELAKMLRRQWGPEST